MKEDCPDNGFDWSDFLEGRNFRFLLLLFACLLAFPFVFARFWLHFNNTVHTSDRWCPTRTNFENRQPGAFVHMFSRYVYAGDRLNLNNAYGVPEYIFCEPLTLRRVEFDFFIPAGSELSFVFGRDAEQYQGLRLSAAPERESMFFTAANDGGFRAVTRIGGRGAELAGGWHRARFAFGPERYEFFVDDALFFSVQNAMQTVPFGGFGFRSSLSGATVDNVLLDAQEYLLPRREDFRNRRSYPRVFSAGLLLMLVLLGMCFLLCRDGGLCPAGRVLGRMLALQVGALALFAALYAFDYLWLGRRVPDRGHVVRFEGWVEDPAVRYVRSPFLYRWLLVFGDYAANDICFADRRIYDRRLLSELTADFARFRMLSPDPYAFRILFACGSQALSEEVPEWKGSYISFARREFEERSPLADKNVMCVNAASRDFCIGGPLEDAYGQHWLKMKPDVFVLGLGRSGACCTISEEVGDDLAAYVRFNRKRGVRSIVLFEANCPEIDGVGTAQCRELAQKTIAEYGLDVIDLDSFMRKIDSTGFCWLDEYRLSAYGHKRAGEFVAARLREILFPGSAPKGAGQ